MHTKNAQGVPNLEDGSYKKFFLDMCQNSLGYVQNFKSLNIIHQKHISCYICIFSPFY